MTNGGISTDLNSGRALELSAVLIIATSAVGLVAARLGVFDAPPIWMAGFLATTLYHRLTVRSTSQLAESVPLWHIAVVLIVGLLFRLTPDAYILGGQDQGVYVNMGMHLARTGGLVPLDEVLARITDPAVRDIYRVSNYTPVFLPGVYAEGPGLTFQFYHLFPVWLALFGDGLGPAAAVYASTFFSLVSLLFFQRLAHQLTGSARAGLFAGVLLAVNPLHAFFSKFPVTEVPTLAFSLIAFVFLLAFWEHRDKGATRFVAISAAAMLMLFMTRITGFMYMPFVTFIVLLALIFESNPATRRALLWWAWAVAGAYAISVFYGLKWSAPYVRDIYAAAFGSVLGQRWQLILMPLAAAGLASLAVLWWLVLRGSPLIVRLRGPIGSSMVLLPVAAVLAAIWGAYNAYRLGFTDFYAGDPWLDQKFDLSHRGWKSVLSTSLGAFALYLSPFMLAAFFLATFRRKAPPVLSALMFFAVCFFGIAMVVTWKVYYHPYYARYLLSELLPYAILLIITVWASAPKGSMRVSLGALLALGGIYTAVLSAAQLGKSEHEGVAASIDKLTSRFDFGDLVLVDRELGLPPANELKTTLMFTKGFKVATVSGADLLSAAYLSELGLTFDESYLLTRRAGAIKGFVEIDVVHFTERAFAHGAAPPVSVWPRIDSTLRVMKYVGTTDRMLFGSRRTNSALGSGWSTPEQWGVWSNATSARINLRADGLDCSGREDAQLVISGRAYVTPGTPVQRISVLTDGELLSQTAVEYPQTSVVLVARLPPRVSEIELRMPDAVSPHSLGASADTRLLAFGIVALDCQDRNPVQ